MRGKLRSTKKFLYDIPHRNERIAEREERINKLKEEKRNILKDAPCADAVAKICDLIEKEMLDLAKQVREINNYWCMALLLFDTLPRREKKILEMRYFQNRDWTYISKQMKLSIRHCRRLHDAAVKEFECFMKDKVI